MVFVALIFLSSPISFQVVDMVVPVFIATVFLKFVWNTFVVVVLLVVALFAFFDATLIVGVVHITVVINVMVVYSIY